jgi:putative endonuclease
LASPATCICAPCNIGRAAIAGEKQLKGWRREKKLNLIGTINPEFKDLAQTWGWKMIAVHEKMYP